MGDDLALLPFDDGSAGRLIRRQWHDGQWFFSVVDVIAILTDSYTPRRYWSDLKRTLHDDEGFEELYARIVQLKMRSADGKKYATDAATVETMLRIIQSVPSPKAEPVRQWLAQVGAQRLEEVAASLKEDQRRQLLRGEISEKNRLLAATATEAGVLTSRDFAVFQDHGYMGLYDGEKARDIAVRKGLGKGQAILDHMGGTELAANLFRVTQAEEKIRRDGVTTRDEANSTHHAVGRTVRKAIAELGGTMPEDLPTPGKSIQEIERDERQRLARESQAEGQPALFSASEDEGES